VVQNGQAVATTCAPVPMASEPPPPLLMFTPAQLLSYLSTFMTLEPGDVILTGTPAGVGLSYHPRRWLKPGQTLVTRIEGIGKLVNTCSQPQ